MSDPDKRQPGRPRSETSRQAILGAALDLVAEAGYANVTVDAVAARAGVGKQTIYRWWATKADVVLEASAAKAELSIPVADRGSYGADLRAFLEAGYTLANTPPIADLLRGLMVEAQLRQDFGERFRTTFLAPRRAAFAVITERAAERGDLPALPDPVTVADIVFGTLWYRILATRQPLDARLVEDLVGLLS